MHLDQLCCKRRAKEKNKLRKLVNTFPNLKVSFFFCFLKNLFFFSRIFNHKKERQENLIFTSRKKASARSRSVISTLSILSRCSSVLLDLMDTFRHLQVMCIFRLGEEKEASEERCACFSTFGDRKCAHALLFGSEERVRFSCFREFAFQDSRTWRTRLKTADLSLGWKRLCRAHSWLLDTPARFSERDTGE